MEKVFQFSKIMELPTNNTQIQGHQFSADFDFLDMEDMIPEDDLILPDPAPSSWRTRSFEDFFEENELIDDNDLPELANVNWSFDTLQDIVPSRELETQTGHQPIKSSKMVTTGKKTNKMTVHYELNGEIVSTKEIVVVPSIKFESVVQFAAKSLCVENGSFVVVDEARQVVSNMDQLLASQSLFLVNNATKTTAITSTKEEEEEEEEYTGKSFLQKTHQGHNATLEDKSPMPDNDTGNNKRSNENEIEMRAPIVCVLGHVDAGKTSLLDQIRKSDVQHGEAGGITQQIGATFIPRSVIQERIAEINEKHHFPIKLPFVVIDTPGHASFTNLRFRGSSLCDIAILVVDITKGLEAQTIESINLLKNKKLPFMVALNKIDRLYGWERYPNAPFQQTISKQKDQVVEEFKKRVNSVISEFAVEGLNAIEYYKNRNFMKFISIVPVSAITGEGMQDLLLLVMLLSQNVLKKRLQIKEELLCHVLEVKVVERLGSTIDVLLIQGELREGDKIVLCGLNGPIVTRIRHLLVPQPLQEIRLRNEEYRSTSKAVAVQGVKVFARDLETVVAGTQLYVLPKKSSKNLEEQLKAKAMEDLENLMMKYRKSPTGVHVQASSLGSLEALLDFLKDSDIPVSGVNIGPVSKKDVMKAAGTSRMYSCILAFDVGVSKHAYELAHSMNVRIYAADVIYHLFDMFKQDTKAHMLVQPVIPCALIILPDMVYKEAMPIIMGVYVRFGELTVNTTLCIPTLDFLEIGVVTAIRIVEDNKRTPVQRVIANQYAVIKLEQNNKGTKLVKYGREFDSSHQLFSKAGQYSQIHQSWRADTRNPFMQEYNRLFGFLRTPVNNV